MPCSATDVSHINKTGNNAPCCKEGTILPSSSLFYQCHHIWRCISHGFTIWNVRKIKTTISFNVNLQTHYSIFGQIFISFRTAWVFDICSFISRFFLVYKLEESIHGSILDSVPSKNTISTRQHGVESKSTLASFIR